MFMLTVNNWWCNCVQMFVCCAPNSFYFILFISCVTFYLINFMSDWVKTGTYCFFLYIIACVFIDCVAVHDLILFVFRFGTCWYIAFVFVHYDCVAVHNWYFICVQVEFRLVHFLAFLYVIDCVVIVHHWSCNCLQAVQLCIT